MSASFYSLAPRMRDVEPSPTVRLNALAQEMAKAGKDVINLTAGETDFDTPVAICDAAVAAIRGGMNKYTAPHGIPELRQGLSRWFLRDFDLQYEPKQITVTAGVKQGIFNLILALIGPGDEVIIPSPYWVSYPEMVRLAGGVPRILECVGEFGLDLDELRSTVNSRTRLLLLNSPNNPSGGVYSESLMREVARILEGTPVLVASDEIYSSLVYDQKKFVAFAGLSEDAYKRTVTFNGLSKSHAMTGWRVGFAAGPTPLIEAMGILQAQSSTHITSFVQAAAIKALEQTKTDFAPRLVEMEKRRNFVVTELKRIPEIAIEPPAGAFYVFPNCEYYTKKVGGSVRLSEILLEDGGLATVPGKPFGDDRRIRLSFAKDLNTLAKGFERFSRVLRNL
jgi:aspartate aminotransferase